MVEVTEGKPVNWTPAMEQTPKQQALREKVSGAMISRLNKKHAELLDTQKEIPYLESTQFDRALDASVPYTKKLVGSTIKERSTPEWQQSVKKLADGILHEEGRAREARKKLASLEAEAVRTGEYDQLKQLNRTSEPRAMNSVRAIVGRHRGGLDGFDPSARDLNRHERRRASMPRDDKNDFQTAPKVDMSTPERGFHGGLQDSKLHIRRRTVGSKGKDSTNMVSQPICDIADSKTRFVSAKPTPYYEPSVGEARVALGFDFIVDEIERGVIVVDPTRRLVSEPMTRERYDVLAKKRGFFPLDLFANDTHQFGVGNPVTDEIARRAISDAIHLLDGAKASKSVHMNEKLEILTGLEKSLLSVIPTP